MKKEKLEDIEGMYRGLPLKAHKALVRLLLIGVVLNIVGQSINYSYVSQIISVLSLSLFTYAILSLVDDSFLLYNPEYVEGKTQVPVPKMKDWLTKYKVTYYTSLVVCGMAWLFGILLGFGLVGREARTGESLTELQISRVCYGIVMGCIGVLFPFWVKAYVKNQHLKERNQAEQNGKLVVIDFSKN